MMNKNANNVIRIPASSIVSFFRYWLEFLRPIHHLSNREIEVLTHFLAERYELSKVVTDSTILDKVVMSRDVKSRIIADCNLTLPHLQVIMGRLRKEKIILDNKLNPKFIPNLELGADSFRLLLLFDLKCNSQKQ